LANSFPSTPKNKIKFFCSLLIYCGFSADVTIKLEESEDLVEEVEDISLDFASKEWGKSSVGFHLSLF
jgi:hypothetical protein